MRTVNQKWTIAAVAVAATIAIAVIVAITQATPADANIYSPATLTVDVSAGQEVNVTVPAFQQTDVPRCLSGNQGFSGLAAMYAHYPLKWNGLVTINKGGIDGALLLHGYALKTGSYRLRATIDCGKEIDSEGNVGTHIFYDVTYNIDVTGTATAPGAHGHAHPQADIYGDNPLFGEVETLSDQVDTLSDSIDVLATRVAQMQTTIGDHIGDEEDAD